MTRSRRCHSRREGGSLVGMTGGVLAATGVDAALLKQVGISLNDVLRCCAPSNDELAKLKYRF